MNSIRRVWKITNPGNFSNGGQSGITWAKRGKEWKTEAALRAYLLVYVTEKGEIPMDWEVVAVDYHPAQSITKWIDNKLLIKILNS